MPRDNYFEILGLNFDPIENVSKIKKTISSWKEQLDKDLQGSHSTLEHQKLIELKNLSDDLEKTMLNKGSRDKEAEEIKNRQLKILSDLIDIIRLTQKGTPEVTTAQIRQIQPKLKLSVQTIENLYREKGYEIQQRKPVDLKDMFLDPTIFGQIMRLIVQMNAMQENHYPWFQKVSNLYDLIAFVSGGTEVDSESYKRKKTGELLDIFQAYAIQYSPDLSPPGHLIEDLLANGTTKVFKTEVLRKQYDSSLKKQELDEFFCLIKTAPEVFKYDEYFAESCISHIQKKFPDYDLALAIYNFEAGLVKNPYEPREAKIRVICSVCETPHEFRTREEAQRSACSVCKTALYIECPNCHKLMPASASKCSCGFYISELRFFEEYLQEAKKALSNLELKRAREQFEKARYAKPSHPDLSDLEKQISQKENQFGRMLENLDQLIGQKKYMAAKKEAESIKRTDTRINISKQQKDIENKLIQVSQLMPTGGVSDSQKASRCLMVLDIVSDYEPAIALLQKLPPSVPKFLNGQITTEPSLLTHLSWQPTGENSVSYHLVRKQRGIPEHPHDGEILNLKDSSASYTDTQIEPGIKYGYALFTKRSGTFSKEAASTILTVYGEIGKDDLIVTTDNEKISFRWVLPKNAVGVQILRSENRIPGMVPSRDTILVASRANNSFTDNRVENHKQYFYRFRTIYTDETGSKLSTGITKQAMAAPMAVKLTNIIHTVKGQICTFTWSSSTRIQNEVLILECKDKNVRNFIQKSLSLDEIYRVVGEKKVLVASNSLANTVSFTLPTNTSLEVAIVTVSGSKALINQVSRLSTVSKIEIDKDRSKFDGNQLLLYLKNLDPSLKTLYYDLRTKTNSLKAWATVEDAQNGKMKRISKKNYMADGFLLFSDLPKEDLCISVIGGYKMPAGKIVFSDPTTWRINNKPKTIITYKVTWSGLLKKKAKNAKLTINSNGKNLPELSLVYKSDRSVPTDLEQSGIQLLQTVPEAEEGYKNGELVINLDDSLWKKAISGTPIRLYMEKDNTMEFDLQPLNGSDLIVP